MDLDADDQILTNFRRLTFMNMMSKMKYNVPVCEWNELFGKIPGARCVRHFLKKNAQNFKCSKSLQQLQKKSSPSPIQKNTVTWWKAESIQTFFYTFCWIGAGGRRLLQWHFHCGSGYFSSWDMCLHVPWFGPWDLWMDPMNSRPVNFMGPQQGIPFLNSESHRIPKRLSQ